jgi:hypothetical protein
MGRDSLRPPAAPESNRATRCHRRLRRHRRDRSASDFVSNDQGVLSCRAPNLTRLLACTSHRVCSIVSRQCQTERRTSRERHSQGRTGFPHTLQSNRQVRLRSPKTVYTPCTQRLFQRPTQSSGRRIRSIGFASNRGSSLPRFGQWQPKTSFDARLGPRKSDVGSFLFSGRHGKSATATGGTRSV